MASITKDIPLAVAMIFLLWLTLRLARRWATGDAYLLDSALVGACAGMAMSIRINAALWFGVLGLAAAGWWWRHRRTVALDLADVRAAVTSDDDLNTAYWLFLS